MCFGNGIVMEKIETVSDNNGVKFEPTLELNSPAAYLQYKNVLKLKRFFAFLYTFYGKVLLFFCKMLAFFFNDFS